MIKKHLNKDNLHHAYLIEGQKEEVEEEIVEFIESMGISTSNNADFCRISVNSFKINDARNLKAFSVEKATSTQKRIFLIFANNFLLEAQNALLKMFEDPIENTHFFLIVPDTNALLKTFVSRFYLISTKQDLMEELKNAEKFISMSLTMRINFIKELLIEPNEKNEEDFEIALLDSSRSKSLRFLNSLEQVLHNKFQKNLFSDVDFFKHFFKVREFLNQPGSSVKSLMESVAIIVPNL